MLKNPSSRTAFVLTPLALAAALATGSVQAQDANAAGNRVAGLVGNVTQALGAGGERAASRAENRADTDRGISQLRAVRNETRERVNTLRARDGNRSLPGLAGADRSVRERAGDTPRDPVALNLAVDTGNLSGARDARGYGLKVNHSTKLHPGTPETQESGFFDKDNETRRTGLETHTGLAVNSPRTNDDGDRERVSNGVELGGELSNHGATDRENGQSFRTASLGGFYVQKSVGEDALGGDDVETNRSGAALKYDSRDGISIDRGNGE